MLAGLSTLQGLRAENPDFAVRPSDDGGRGTDIAGGAGAAVPPLRRRRGGVPDHGGRSGYTPQTCAGIADAPRLPCTARPPALRYPPAAWSPSVRRNSRSRRPRCHLADRGALINPPERRAEATAAFARAVAGHVIRQPRTPAIPPSAAPCPATPGKASRRAPTRTRRGSRQGATDAPSPPTWASLGSRAIPSGPRRPAPTHLNSTKHARGDDPHRRGPRAGWGETAAFPVAPDDLVTIEAWKWHQFGPRRADRSASYVWLTRDAGPTAIAHARRPRAHFAPISDRAVPNGELSERSAVSSRESEDPVSRAQFPEGAPQGDDAAALTGPLLSARVTRSCLANLAFTTSLNPPSR